MKANQGPRYKPFVCKCSSCERLRAEAAAKKVTAQGKSR